MWIHSDNSYPKNYGGRDRSYLKRAAECSQNLEFSLLKDIFWGQSDPGLHWFGFFFVPIFIAYTLKQNSFQRYTYHEDEFRVPYQRNSCGKFPFVATTQCSRQLIFISTQGQLLQGPADYLQESRQVFFFFFLQKSIKQLMTNKILDNKWQLCNKHDQLFLKKKSLFKPKQVS